MARNNDENPTDNENKELGQAIAMFRKMKDMTQEDLAGEAEVDRSYLSEIESGHKNISVSILRRIARALGVKASYLLGERDGKLSEDDQ